MKSFDEMEAAARALPTRKVAIAMAQESGALAAAVRAAEAGICAPILIGDTAEIQAVAQTAGIQIGEYRTESVSSEEECASRAVALVRSGEADILMKGTVSTTVLMRAVLHRENGLRDPGQEVVSQVTIVEPPSYHKLLVMTDPGLNIRPDVKRKVELVNNAVLVANQLGIDLPKVAIIAAIEKVDPEAMPHTADAAVLSKMAERSQIKRCIVDGPLALDNAVSARSCEIKGIRSEVGGDADILVLPDIESANVLYKAFAFLTDYRMAGLGIGARVPIVLASRSDGVDNKYYSLVAASCVLGESGR